MSSYSLPGADRKLAIFLKRVVLGLDPRTSTQVAKGPWVTPWNDVLIKILSAIPILILAACAPSVQPMGPAVDVPALTDTRFRAVDGVELPVAVTRPDGTPKAVILALHGFNDYSNAFAEPAKDWAKQGILTIALDQRGFGQTRRRGIWPGSTTMVADAMGLAQAARERWPGLPITLAGESMGGAVTLLAAQPPAPAPVDRIVLLAPAVWGRDTLGVFGSASLWLFAHTLPWLEVTPQNLNIAPSDNIAMLRALGRDPLVIKRTRIDAIYGLVDLMSDAQAAAPKLTLPALVLWGGREELIPDAAQDRFNADLPTALVRIETLGRGYHMLLRDLNAGPARQAVADWALQARR